MKFKDALFAIALAVTVIVWLTVSTLMVINAYNFATKPVEHRSGDYYR